MFRSDSLIRTSFQGMRRTTLIPPFSPPLQRCDRSGQQQCWYRLLSTPSPPCFSHSELHILPIMVGRFRSLAARSMQATPARLTPHYARPRRRSHLLAALSSRLATSIFTSPHLAIASCPCWRACGQVLSFASIKKRSTPPLKCRSHS